jgi:hypothetical protein
MDFLGVFQWFIVNKNTTSLGYSIISPIRNRLLFLKKTFRYWHKRYCTKGKSFNYIFCLFVFFCNFQANESPPAEGRDSAGRGQRIGPDSPCIAETLKAFIHARKTNPGKNHCSHIQGKLVPTTSAIYPTF